MGLSIRTLQEWILLQNYVWLGIVVAWSIFHGGKTVELHVVESRWISKSVDSEIENEEESHGFTGRRQSAVKRMESTCHGEESCVVQVRRRGQ